MLPLPDQETRNAALDIHRSFHLEAPAGSGKTWLLTGRFLELLAEVDHPYEILALTFTNKAAGEMRQRIRELLARAAINDLPRLPGEEPLLKAANRANKRQPVHSLAPPDSLRIMTFHGFCLHLVQRAPVEAVIPPGSRVMSDEEQQKLRSQVAAATIHSLFRRSGSDPLRQALENRLLRLNNNWPSFLTELSDLLERRDLLAQPLALLSRHPDPSEFAAILAKRLETLLQLRLENCRYALESTVLGANWSEFFAHLYQRNAEACKRLPDMLPAADAAKLQIWQEIASSLTTAGGKPRKRLGPAAGFYGGFSKSEWADAIQKLSKEAVDHLQSIKSLPTIDEAAADLNNLYDLILVVGEALGQYQTICRQRHLLDYVELEQAALRLFDQGTPTDMQLFLDRRIHHLLVDEFQDTSRNQWLLLQNLCSGWPVGSGRTLFLVGDPKQSIYGFRKAEVSLFLEAKEGLPIPGQDRFPMECLQLETNFRSHPRLISWCNQIFGQTIMTKTNPETDEISHVPSKALSRPSPDNLSLTLFSFDNGGSHARVAEAEWLGRSVRRELEHLPEGEKISILLFTRTYLSVYLQALQDAGVAVRVQEGVPLLEQREVLHLRQIARALVRPQDDLAWAALLRAPWSHLSLEQFVQVARRSELSWLDKLRGASSEFPVVARLWEALSKARRRVGRDDLATLVENVWVDLDGPETLASQGSAAEVANGLCFLEIISQAEQGIPEETLEKAGQLLQNAYAPPDASAAPSPVELMTVHRAKGLEFDVVFLPFLDWYPLSGGRGSQPPYLLEKLPGPEGEHLIAMAPDRRRETTGGMYRLLREMGETKRLAEAKRILYVAVTRARRSLYLSGITRTANGELLPRRESPLWWLCRHHRLRQSPNGRLVAENNSYLNLYMNPEADPEHPGEPLKVVPLPESLPFSPEPLPYISVAPSQLADRHQVLREEEEDPNRRARGIVTHNLLEYLSQGCSLPGSAALVAALLSEGVPESEAGGMAEDILREVRDCLQEEFFIWLLNKDHPQAYSEWSLEDRRAPNQIRSGTMDRVVFDGNTWWVVDYKTSRPLVGESVDEFLEREVDHYRLQLPAYRDMVANAFSLDLDSVRPVLYFTALQQKVELD